MKVSLSRKALWVLYALVASVTTGETVFADEKANMEIESLVKNLTSDTVASRNSAESGIRDGGSSTGDIWRLVEKAIETKDTTLLNGTYSALEITGLDSEAVKRHLKKMFEFEKKRISTLRTWGDTLRDWDSIFVNNEDPDDPKIRRQAYFEVEYRAWVVHTAFLLGKDLNESEDVHPFLLPKLHAIMLSGLKWIEIHGTEESVPVLDAILAKEPKNAGKGGIADFANSALIEVLKRKSQK